MLSISEVNRGRQYYLIFFNNASNSRAEKGIMTTWQTKQGAGTGARLMTELTHLDAEGKAQMVDVGEKAVTRRVARAGAVVRMQPETLQLISSGGHRKGDVLAVARIAGLQAAKKCADLIPLCHPLMLTSVKVDITLDEQSSSARIVAECGVDGKTGVEMEALTAASVAALTLYDMCKAVDRGMVIEAVQLLEKSGGRSGHYLRDTRLRETGQGESG